tara:strand:+ start:72 stop:371 length:300 start_codon:yes stop_codon:yes gene_type:complete
MDQSLVTTGQLENALQEQHEFMRTGFNITVDSEIGIMENQIILFNILCSFRWILLTHIVMLFVITVCLAYVMKLLEKLEKYEEDDIVPVNQYVELKDPV